MTKFKTQQEIWEYVSSGKSVYLEGTEIKFIDGFMKAHHKGVFVPCPISFENPKLFKKIIND